jgi:hypothetical protein
MEKEMYSRLDIWRLQVKSSCVHDTQNYQDIFEIENSILYPDTKDVLLNQDYHVQQEKVQTRNPHHFQKKHLVQDVDPGVRLDIIP